MLDGFGMDHLTSPQPSTALRLSVVEVKGDIYTSTSEELFWNFFCTTELTELVKPDCPYGER